MNESNKIQSKLSAIYEKYNVITKKKLSLYKILDKRKIKLVTLGRQVTFMEDNKNKVKI